MSRVGTIAVTQIFTSVKNWVNSKLPTKTSELTNDSNFLTPSSSLNASKLTGTIDIARLPQGALERVITVANQTARFALTTSSVQLGDTVKQLDTGVMYVVVNESKLNSNDGYLEYTAGSASSVPWSGITSKPTEFTPSSHTHTKSEITDFPTNVSAFTNDSGYLTSHQSLSNYVTLNTAQEITNAKTFKDTTTARKLTSVEAGNVIPTSDKLISDIWQDKNGKELGRIYYTKTKDGKTALIMRAGDWFSESEGVYSLNASGTNRRAELQLYTDSSGNCCIKPNGLFSTHIKPLDSSVYLGDSTKPFGRVYANSFQFCNAGLLPNTDVQTTEEHSVGFFGKNNAPLSYITFQKRPNLKDRIAIRIQTSSSSYKSYDFDANCLYPEVDNSLDIGSTTNIFKNIYCNNYYKGTTAFGDIVTHNASEFLTEHQSLANYVTTNTSQSISGIKTFPTNINLANTSTSQREYWALKFSKTDTNGTGVSQLGVFQPSNSNDFVACLRLGNPRGDNKPTSGSGVNTGNCWSGIGVYYNYALNRGYPYASNCTSWGDSSNADAELASTSWVRRYCETTKGFLTSHQSLANYVTTNTDQSISGIKSHSKHISILGDYIGNESSINGRSCLYLKANRDTDGKSGLYITKFRQNVAQGSMGNSDVVFLSHDILENETRTNAAFVESYSNWENDVPGGMSIYSTIATRNLGTSAKPWTNTYAVNFYENGTALSSKYALNENFGKGMTTYLYIKSTDFPTGSSNKAIQYNDVVDGTKLYVWYSVCNSSSILDIHPTATKVTSETGQVWRYLGPTIYAAGLGHDGASPTGILGLFRRES